MKLNFPYKWFLLSPFILYGIGAFLNVLAVTVNKGTMPVIMPLSFWQDLAELEVKLPAGAMIDEVHKIMIHSDRLKFLCDWIQLPHVGTASPGDMFIWLGEWSRDFVIGAWLALVYKDHN